MPALPSYPMHACSDSTSSDSGAVENSAATPETIRQRLIAAPLSSEETTA